MKREPLRAERFSSSASVHARLAAPAARIWLRFVMRAAHNIRPQNQNESRLDSSECGDRRARFASNQMPPHFALWEEWRLLALLFHSTESVLFRNVQAADVSGKQPAFPRLLVDSSSWLVLI